MNFVHVYWLVKDNRSGSPILSCLKAMGTAVARQLPEAPQEKGISVPLGRPRDPPMSLLTT